MDLKSFDYVSQGFVLLNVIRLSNTFFISVVPGNSQLRRYIPPDDRYYTAGTAVDIQYGIIRTEIRLNSNSSKKRAIR